MSSSLDSPLSTCQDDSPDTANVELSVVMPCLNEAETLGTCLAKARRALNEAGIDGELVVADNGSTDGSLEIAAEHGARVVHVEQRGYGYALMGGITASRGKYVLMGDADDSYDFLEIPRFVEKLREDYAQGHFTTYETYQTSTGFVLASIEDAIAFNNFHEGIHLGYILALRRVVTGEGI